MLTHHRNNRILLCVLCLILFFSMFSALSGCANSNSKIQENMLTYANEKYNLQFTKIDFKKDYFDKQALYKLTLKDSKNIYFTVSALKHKNNYTYSDNYIDMKVSKKIQDHIEKLDVFKECDGVFCINAILKNRNYELKDIKDISFKDIIDTLTIEEINFIYNPIGKIGYILKNIENIYSMYFQICTLFDIENINFDVVVTDEKNDTLINCINTNTCPVYTSSEWYEKYNLQYDNKKIQYKTNTVISESLIVPTNGITDLSFFYSFRDDLSYDYNEYLNEIDTKKEHTTKNVLAENAALNILHEGLRLLV